MTPALAPPPMAPKPPAPAATSPGETFGLGPAPVTPVTSSPSALPPIPTSEPTQATPPPPPMPPGEYTQSRSFTLSEAWLMFVPVVCVGLIFVLSFPAWHSETVEYNPAKEKEIPIVQKVTPALSLWGLSFTDKGHGHFLAYTLLMIIPILPLIIVALVFERIPAPPGIAPLMLWKHLLAGLLLALTFLMLLYDYIDGNLLQRVDPIALPEKLAIRLHFIAMLASFGMFWLNWRKQTNLPPPKVELRT
jgi:hypothetical protein